MTIIYLIFQQINKYLFFFNRFIYFSKDSSLNESINCWYRYIKSLTIIPGI